MVDWHRVIKPHGRIAARVIGDQALILDPRSDELQRLNSVGSFIWAQILTRSHAPQDILPKIVVEFEVSEDEAREDLARFIDKLEARSLVVYQTD